LGYFEIDLYTQFINDWQKSFEIVIAFIEGLNEGWMVGYSYNRYSGDRPLSHITVRFNFTDDDEGKRNVERIINDLTSRRLIVANGEWRAFERSVSVTKATEVSTKCALAFKNWMDRNPGALRYYTQSPQNRIQFMARFLALLLQQLGFQTYHEQYPIAPDFINLIKDCATYCAEQVKQDFNHELDVDFMERVIHHFLNCVHINLNEEQYVYAQIRHWEWLGNLLDERSQRG